MMGWIAGRERVRNTITLLIPLMLATCGSPEPVPSNLAAISRGGPPPAQLQQPSPELLSARLSQLDRAVSRWRAASTIQAAHEAAEEARNLIVGESGPFYGDANNDGRIAGANSLGILPGLKGEASLAKPNDNACVVADIRGGSWREPARRWSEFESALSRWTVSHNTFPSLPSHAQRVVGWASLTLKSGSLSEAREYAKHARLHVDIAVRALNGCRR